jgi:hypothetical protein
MWVIELRSRCDYHRSGFGKNLPSDPSEKGPACSHVRRPEPTGEVKALPMTRILRAGGNIDPFMAFQHACGYPVDDLLEIQSGRRSAQARRRIEEILQRNSDRGCGDRGFKRRPLC